MFVVVYGSDCGGGESDEEDEEDAWSSCFGEDADVEVLVGEVVGVGLWFVVIGPGDVGGHCCSQVFWCCELPGVFGVGFWFRGDGFSVEGKAGESVFAGETDWFGVVLVFLAAVAELSAGVGSPGVWVAVGVDEKAEPVSCTYWVFAVCAGSDR